MSIIKFLLDFLDTMIMPLMIDGSPNMKAFPEHFDAETTICTASKLVHFGNDDKCDCGYRQNKIYDLRFHFSWSFASL